ncbi:MAG: hypothetical protein M5U28_20300 [Sandaracinaceae bacterium]|nr:hypothetical protein [Sandaracinaceae bacterium]
MPSATSVSPIDERRNEPLRMNVMSPSSARRCCMKRRTSSEVWGSTVPRTLPYWTRSSAMGGRSMPRKRRALGAPDHPAQPEKPTQKTTPAPSSTSSG